MNRRNLIKSLTIAGSALATSSAFHFSKAGVLLPEQGNKLSGAELHADIIIAGGGLGGCAAAFSALRNGLSVIMTEETDWIGGQPTQQGVSCFDEHQWIEEFGATQSYRNFRTAIREYYVENYPLSEVAKAARYLNPGNGSVSRLCIEPTVALAVLYQILTPYLSSHQLVLLLRHKAVNANAVNDKVDSLEMQDLENGNVVTLKGQYFLDATELGDLLPITGTEYVTGSESKEQTHELHASEVADPDNQQAFTVCFAMDHIADTNNVIEKPKEYDFWRNYFPQLLPPWSGKLLSLEYADPRNLKPKSLGFNPAGILTDHKLNLWNYRRIIDPANFKEGFYSGGITIVNWPQNDFLSGNLVGVHEKEFKENIQRAEQLSLSLFYWLQTEAPNLKGDSGWPGLRLRGDILGTENGLAKFPYIRESRRIKAVFTVLEEHVGAENRVLVAGEKEGKRAAFFHDSVGVGYYHIDLHPTSAGNNYIDFNSLPFQIPLGALIPVRMKNLLPACKNIGTTHITNGCYREHPEEWNIGESGGLLAAYAIKNKILPHAVREDRNKLEAFQNWIRLQGVETQWPEKM